MVSGKSRNFRGGGGAKILSNKNITFKVKMWVLYPNFIIEGLFCFSNSRGAKAPLAPV